MKRERLRASVVCEELGHLLVVRLRDPASGVEAFYPPGGAIEANETPAQAGERETLEETGLRVCVDPMTELVEQYPFRWAGIDYAVTTHYFRATLGGPFDKRIPRVLDAAYNVGAYWIPTSLALEAMSLHPRIAAATARVLHRTVQ